MLIPSRGGKHPPTPNGRSATHHLFWARNALYHGLRALDIKSGDKVLIPAYHCTSVVEPILQYGGEVDFFNIDLDLEPDLREIESKIDSRTRAVLVIHYFGFPAPIAKIKKFCRERGLFLIEDCAHVLFGRTEEGMPLGTLGDISVFSWRKFLPMYDGGQLVLNNPALRLDVTWNAGSPLFSLKIFKNLFDKLMEDSPNRFLNRIGVLSRAPTMLFRRMAAANGYGQNLSSVNSYDLDFDLASANLKISRLSRYIMSNTDIEDVAKKRRLNYRILAEGIEPMAGVRPVFPALPEHIVPWVFPLLSCGVKNLHLELRRRGIPATNWSGVIHRNLPLERYPDAQFLYDNIVFLPVHQSLDQTQLRTLLSILGVIVGKRVTARCQKF